MSGEVDPAPISRVTVIGGGYMGTGILQVLAMSGVTCVLADMNAERTRVAHGAAMELAADYEGRGYFPAGAAATVQEHSRPAEDLADAVADAELVIEVVPERLDVKQALFRELEALVGADTILASNTSSITIASLAAVLRRPERMYGIHWFNPAQFLPSIEIVAGPDARPGTTERILTLLRYAGRKPVVVPDAPGFVANRLQFALFREAALMVDDGLISPERLDEVVRGSFGYRLPYFGPFEIADIAGLDVYAAIFDVLENGLGERFRCPPGLRDHVAAGRLGLKSGEGFGSYTAADREAITDRRDRAYLTMAGALARWQAGGSR